MDGTAAMIERLGAGGAGLPGAALPWLRDLRAGAMDSFARTGLPGPRLEAWKYTDLRPLEKLAFRAGRGDSPGIARVPSLFPHGQGVHRIVFVNGHFRADLSALAELPAGVTLGSLAGAMENDAHALSRNLGRIAGNADQPLLALNTGLMSDGVVLRVGAGVSVESPIEVIAIGAATPQAPLAYHGRNLMVLEAGSRATVVEHHAGLGNGAYLANLGGEILIGDGAALTHYKVQAEDDDAFHLATVHAEVGEDGFYDSFLLTRGARLSRNEISLRLARPGARCQINGIYMLRGGQHCDNTTVVDHLAPDTSSRAVFKGVLDERARGVFQGRIVVHPQAQRSDGHQLSRALLLSDQAEIDAKPELLIHADDVKCSHGATAGDIDRDALFYLRARGIPERSARHMLVEAFLADTIGDLATEGPCPALMSSIGHWLSDTARGGTP